MANFQGDGKAIFQVFIGAIIAIAILTTVGNAIFTQTNELTITNVTVTAPAVNATLDLTGRTLVSQTAVVNASNGTQTNVGMFLQTGTGTDGLNSVQLTLNDTAAAFAGVSLNVSYVFQPEGYLSNTGARAITVLILLFGSLGILVFVLVVFIKNGSLGKLMGRS